MEGLQKTNQSSVPVRKITGQTIPGIAHNILLTLTDPFVKDISDLELWEYCKKSITRAFADSGFKVHGATEAEKGNELKFLYDSLTVDIRTYFPLLRAKEIEIAVSRGVRGEYGEYMGLTPKVFYNFIKHYLQDAMRAAALQEFHKPEEVNTEPDDDQKLAIEQTCIVKAYSDYLKNGWYEDYGNTVGQILNKYNLFFFKESEIETFKTVAVENLKNKNNPKFARTKQQAAAYNEVLARLEGKNNQMLSKDTLVQMEAMKVAVLVYFKRLSDSGKSIFVVLDRMKTINKLTS